MSSEQTSTERLTIKPCPSPLVQQRRQNLAVIGLGQRGLKVVDPAHVEQMPMRVGGVDDGEAALVELEMPLEQRQDAPADGAKADQNDRAGDFAMNGPVRHFCGLLGKLEMVQRVKSREGCFNQVGGGFWSGASQRRR